MTIGWALLGPGRHAERNVVTQLRKAADTRLVAVFSRDRARGEAFAQRHGIAKVHTALPELLRDPEIDAIYDATPDGLHADNVIAAAEAGKHALVEKPLAISMEGCERAIEACRRHGVKLGVVFQQRHEEVHREARRMVQAGEIGAVTLATVSLPMARPAQPAPPPTGGNWRADAKMRRGGIAMSIGDHAFDTLSFLVGQDIEEVCALTDATRDDPPNERMAGMMLKLSKGAIGYATASWNMPFGRRPFEIHGTKASLVIANSYGYLIGGGGDKRPTLEIVGENGATVRHFDASECFRLEVEQFNRHIAGKGEPTTTPGEGLRALAITEAIYGAARSGRTTKVADFMPKMT